MGESEQAEATARARPGRGGCSRWPTGRPAAGDRRDGGGRHEDAAAEYARSRELGEAALRRDPDHARFRDAIDALPDDELRPVLVRLATLFALHAIETDRAWFLEAGYIETGKARAVRALVTELCGELRPDAVGLVDGLGIPGELLGAIGR